jgi:hypothetical protein
LRATIKTPKWDLLLYTEFDYKTGLFEEKHLVHIETLHSTHTDIQYVESRYTDNKVNFLCVVWRWMGNGGTVPIILYLCTGWRWLVNFMVWVFPRASLYTLKRGKNFHNSGLIQPEPSHCIEYTIPAQNYDMW